MARLAVEGLNSGVDPDSLVLEVGTSVVEDSGGSEGEEDVLGDQNSVDIIEDDGVDGVALLEPGLDDLVGGGKVHLHEEPLVLVESGEFFLGEDDFLASFVGDLDEQGAFSGVELNNSVSGGFDVGSLFEGVGGNLSFVSVEASEGIKLDPESETVVLGLKEGVIEREETGFIADLGFKFSVWVQEDFNVVHIDVMLEEFVADGFRIGVFPRAGL